MASSVATTELSDETVVPGGPAFPKFEKYFVRRPESKAYETHRYQYATT